MVGTGPKENSLPRLAKNLDVATRIHILGFREDAIDILSVSGMCAVPSHSEGLPCVTIEALSMRCPVFASAVGGLPEIVGEGCWRLMPPGNSHVLAHAI